MKRSLRPSALVIALLPGVSLFKVAIISQTINVGCAGVNEHGIVEPIAYYDAASGQLMITLPAQGFTISIYDNLGQMVKEFQAKNLNETVSTSDLASGVYTLMMSDGNGMHSMKFVK